jgi:DNA repair protein RadC
MKASRRVEAEWCVARGGLHGCGLLPADVLRPVLRSATSAFILVHNHPSGDPTPSRDDVLMTRALQQACLTVGVTLVDHVIVSRSGSYSLAEACLMNGAGSWNPQE